MSSSSEGIVISMVRPSAVAMMALAFALGLLFGVMLHMDLPGVSSPLHHHQQLSRHQRDVSISGYHPSSSSSSEEREEWGAMIDLGVDEPTEPYDDKEGIYSVKHDQQTKQYKSFDKAEQSVGQQKTQPRNPRIHRDQGGEALSSGSVAELASNPHRTIEQGEAPASHAQPRTAGETHPVHDGSPASTDKVKQKGSAQASQEKPAMTPEEREQVVALGGVVHGVTWTPEMEQLAPRAFTDEQVSSWRQEVSGARMVGMQEGCGRMQNRLLVLDTGARACARYRVNTDQIQGELYSFFLSRLLGLEQVPPPVVMRPDPQDGQWTTVDRELAKAAWSVDRPVLLTPWISQLTPTYIPKELRPDSRALTPSQPHKLLTNRSMEELGQLVQWSDLVVFDYLTANLDRVVNNMFNKQWNPTMMDSAAHNLERDPETGRLLFLDNESGLFHSYRLLDKYHHYHDKLLSALCIFRPDTVKAIKDLHQGQDVGTRLMNLVKMDEPLADLVPRLPDKNAAVLQQRIQDVYQQISHCEQIYS